MKEKLWEISPQSDEGYLNLMHNCAIGELPARVLSSRGYEAKDALSLLQTGEESLHDPFLLPDMQKAVDAINESIENGEKICVFGDYDCDGITATVMVYDYLTNIGADVFFCLPKREKDGYGLNNNTIDEIHSRKAALIITVDNGISSIEEASYAKSLGIKMVITDHHIVGDQMPDALAVINPHRSDSVYPFSDLCGAGVAFKLLSALEGDFGQTLLEQYGDILAIGTIADLVNLIDENRYIVKYGLEILHDTSHPGLKILMEKAGLKFENLESYNISFGLAPRINAAGRVADAIVAANMILEEDEQKAEELVNQLCEYNDARRASETEAFGAIKDILRENKSIAASRVVIVNGSGWNHGVAGIVSSRLAEILHKPCMVITEEDGIARGSGRSVDGFSLIEAISSCSQYLTRFGGHPMACGVTLEPKNISSFRQAMQEYAKLHFEEMPTSKLKIDSVIEPTLLKSEEVSKLNMLKPFGTGNEIPVFAIINSTIDMVIALSDGKHTKLKLSKNNISFFVVCFGTNTNTFPYQKGDRVDVAFNMDITSYMGTDNVSLKLCGIRPAGSDSKVLFKEFHEYEKFLLGEPVSKEICPARSDAVIIYREIQKNPQVNYEILNLYRKLHLENTMSFVKFHIALDALNELKMVEIIDGKVKLILNPERKEFTSAPIIQKFANII